MGHNQLLTRLNKEQMTVDTGSYTQCSAKGLPNLRMLFYEWFCEKSYIRICLISNQYIITSILMYEHPHNQELQNNMFYHKNKVM
jgi:hypothetical protein